MVVIIADFWQFVGVSKDQDPSTTELFFRLFCLTDGGSILMDFLATLPVVVSSEFQSLLILPWASRCILHDRADSFWVWEFWTLQKSSHLARA